MTTSTRFLGALVLALSFAGLPASAEAQSDDWEFVIAPYALFGNLTGEAAVIPSQATPVDLDFGDLLESMRFATIVHAEVWKGNWGVMGDLIWMRLGEDITLPGPASLVLDIEVDQFIIEGFLGRRFLGPNRQLDLFGGVRVWDVGIDLELVDTERAQGLGAGWVDPVIGGRIIQDVAEDWYVTARGDMGGFGAGSDFSWNLQGGIGWEAASWFSLLLQYKALLVDYENAETGVDFFSYNTTAYGPLIAFIFRF